MILPVRGMNLLLRVEVPGLPPSANNYWRRSGRSVYKTPGARRWQNDAAIILRERWQQPPCEAEVYVEVVCHTRRWKSIDADNRLKAAQDCLEMAGVLCNDRQARGSAAWKTPAKGRVETTIIEVWTWPQ